MLCSQGHYHFVKPCPNLQQHQHFDDHCDAEDVEALMPDEYNVWSDGSIETDEVTGVSLAGAEAFSLQSGMAWNTGHWVSS